MQQNKSVFMLPGLGRFHCSVCGRLNHFDCFDCFSVVTSCAVWAGLADVLVTAQKPLKELNLALTVAS